MIAVVNDIATPHVDWLAIAPELSLAGAAVLIVLLRALIRRRPGATMAAFVVAAAGVLAAGGTLAWQWIHVRDDGPITHDGGHGARRRLRRVPRDHRRHRDRARAPGVGRLPASRSNSKRPSTSRSMLFSALGMVIMTTANNLIVVFLALEVLSIPLYVLAAFDRRRLSSQEAGIKYFVLGAFSSAIFLYGIALVYGATGTTSLTGHRRSSSRRTRCSRPARWWPGSRCCSSVSGFKVAAVPFHTWTPDVYQGAPTPVTSFMASATKTAGFAALLRVFLVAFPLYRDRLAARGVGRSPCSRSRSAASAPRCRPTSSACSPTRRSRTPATCSSGFEAATARGSRSIALLPLRVHVHGRRVVRGGQP